MSRRAASCAAGLCLAWAAADVPAADTASGLLPLTAQDLATVPRAQCEAAVLARQPEAAGARRALMRIGNGSGAWARFALLPGSGGRPDLAERLVGLNRTGREELGRGRFRVVYGGALPVEVDPLHFKTYQVTLVLEAAGSCPARDGLPCTSYNGTLQADYRFMGFGTQVPTVGAPAVPVQLHEWCPRESYRYYGMFAFPGWLDKIGGFLLRSR